MKLRTTLLLGGALELEVPVSVAFTYHAGFRGDRIDPPEPASAEWRGFWRLDGLPMHDGVWSAFEAWWEADGQTEAIQHARDSRDEALERRAEWRREEVEG